MANTINLLLGVHNHQPVDNWDHVMEEATRQCYQPFLDVLEAHPKVGMTVHFTGYLLDWLYEKHPHLIKQVSHLVKRGQVELFTGGHYEPIFAIIPDTDKSGQIHKLTRRIQELTNATPKGMWLAERVWEPHLVEPFAQAGVEYVFLDDSHFMATGLDTEELYGRYITEEAGHTLEIFPVNQMLRYQIPYAQPQEVIDYLGSIASADGQRTAIYMDDGEKMGVWPGSYKLVYKEKWLDKFFTLLEENADWIHTITPSQYRAKTRPLGRLYLPTASYSEMMMWAMPPRHINLYQQAKKEVPEQYQRFLRAGFWRNFLVKYAEANTLHKKMLYVSRKIQAAQTSLKFHGHPTLVEAEDHLWKGQSNDVFWHGVFGGLYLTNLRTANYQHLIQAENLVDHLTRGASFFETREEDIDCDGARELIIETPAQNLYLDPGEGGCLYELDFRERHFNLLDTLSRRYEAYHDELKEKAGSHAEHLHYDWHRRASLLDHFLAPDTTLKSFSQVAYGEQGDFVNQPYEYAIDGNTVTLARTGTVWNEGQAHRIRVEKQLEVSPDKAETRIIYTLTNLGDQTAPLWFAPEFNVNFLAPDAPDRYYYLPTLQGRQDAKTDAAPVATLPEIKNTKLESKGTLTGIQAIGMRDEWLKIDYCLQWDQAAEVWRFPIQTISQAEYGFDKVYQSSVILPNWKLELAPDQSWQATITQTVT